jgi:hypothetical protein
MFIPIKQADGTTMIASKQNIVSIIEKPGTEQAASEAEAAPEPRPAETAAGPNEDAGRPEKEDPHPEAATAKSEEERPEPEAPKGEESERLRRGKKRFDPYEILRIAKDAGPEDIRKAYHARMKQVHPDTIAALDLDEDLARAAKVSAQRVNRAYQILMRERHESQKPEESAA